MSPSSNPLVPGAPPPLRMNKPSEIAALMHAQWDLGLSSGVLVANPVPEADAMDPEQVERAITRALADAETHGVTGKDVTPYLLARIVELTGEQSLRSNIALVKNNARLAAQIADAFHRQLS
ncbi:MAG: pseudouridine-5'-phosphate glycosidase [Myxococcota bacterium]